MHYAAYRQRLCPDDRSVGLAALDLPHARHIAEVGCGPGYYALTIASRYPSIRVTGIDNAPAQLALARHESAQRGLRNTSFVHDDACALVQRNEQFDRIIASRLFMILQEPHRAMAELRRVLAPGGILVIVEPIARPALSFADWAHIAPAAERIFSATAFAALVSPGAWQSCTIWESGVYRYARCQKAAP